VIKEVFMDTQAFNNLLTDIPSILNGDWISKNSAYETELCQEIGWNLNTNRYFDAEKNNICIEIKKGKSIWLDLVRYSEIVLNIGEQNTITAFFIPNQRRTQIEKIYFVETSKIINHLKIDTNIAQRLISLNQGVPRSLNCQASLTVRDISSLAFYTKIFS
jgi:hypothetical protein